MEKEIKISTSESDERLVERQSAGKITFHYIKSNYFRVIHADGINGSVVPNGLIQMALFNERLPIPQQVVHELRESGELGPEVLNSRVCRNGIIREVECEVLMSIETAKSIQQWLGERIRQAEEIQRQIEALKRKADQSNG